MSAGVDDEAPGVTEALLAGFQTTQATLNQQHALMSQQAATSAQHLDLLRKQVSLNTVDYNDRRSASSKVTYGVSFETHRLRVYLLARACRTPSFAVGLHGVEHHADAPQT